MLRVAKKRNMIGENDKNQIKSEEVLQKTHEERLSWPNPAARIRTVSFKWFRAEELSPIVWPEHHMNFMKHLKKRSTL